jgi:RES domain-containing protein
MPYGTGRSLSRISVSILGATNIKEDWSSFAWKGKATPLWMEYAMIGKKGICCFSLVNPGEWNISILTWNPENRVNGSHSFTGLIGIC